MFRRLTAALGWDDLDAQECTDAVPDWDTMIAVGPRRRRDEHGQVTLEWTVTVQCRPSCPRETATSEAPTGGSPAPSR